MGRAHARVLAREGAKVVVSDIEAESAEEVADEIRTTGGEALATRHDVSISGGSG